MDNKILGSNKTTTKRIQMLVIIFNWIKKIGVLNVINLGCIFDLISAATATVTADTPAANETRIFERKWQ